MDGERTWGIQAGARTSRQENIQTELVLPLAQAGARAATDALAAVLFIGVLLVLGRGAVWALGFLFFFSEWWQRRAAGFVMRFTGPAASVVHTSLALLQWIWTLGGGWLLSAVVVPVTWTLDGKLLIQNAQLAPAWPIVFWRAPWWEMAFGPFARLLALVVLVAPLFTWAHLRNRMRWALMEITPFAAIDPTKPGVGLNPDTWGQTPSEAQKRGAGAIIERVDYDPHETVVAEGVAISNASGSHVKRIDMGWVTREQWERVAYLLVVRGENFSEQNFGRGLVFPTHGPEDVVYGGNLGFRFFRKQMLDAGLLEHRGSHPNEGYQLTVAGKNFLTRFLSDDDLSIQFDEEEGDGED